MEFFSKVFGSGVEGVVEFVKVFVVREDLLYELFSLLEVNAHPGLVNADIEETDLDFPCVPMEVVARAFVEREGVSGGERGFDE